MSRALSAEQRGDLAEELLPVAAHLAVLVHGDGGPEDVQETIAGLSGGQRDALLVVLAGLVDPDRPLGELLGWLDFDEHGRPVVPAWGNGDTLRGISDEEDAARDWSGPDRAVIDQWLRGRPVKLGPEDRLPALLEGLRRGLSYAELDQLAGARPGSSYRWLLRQREAAQARGDAAVFEVMPAPAGSRLTPEQVVELRERSAAGATDLELAMSVGVTRKTVTDAVSGVSYPDAGGPVRARRGAARPRETSRAVWLGSGEKGSIRRGCAA